MVFELKYVIIVAGGSGQRMNTAVPKQFIPIAGKPILMQTIEAFTRFDKDLKPILVLPDCHVSYWESLCEEYHFDVEHQVVVGGETRFESVKNGLDALPQIDKALVAVHDGVRPMVSNDTISTCFESASRYGSGVPVVALVDSIRRVEEDVNFAEDRRRFRLVQTPQVFDYELLQRAYCQAYTPLFTDDASVVEALGVGVHLVEGNRENIKITTQDDLVWAEVFLKKSDE
jgi:2-C-methyl-D-erythritol 4-phosphate cytidylyltransferase